MVVHTGECQVFFLVPVLSLRAALGALVILCPVYHLHTSHVTMMSFARLLNEIPLRPESSALARLLSRAYWLVLPSRS